MVSVMQSLMKDASSLLSLFALSLLMYRSHARKITFFTTLYSLATSRKILILVVRSW